MHREPHFYREWVLVAKGVRVRDIDWFDVRFDRIGRVYVCFYLEVL